VLELLSNKRNEENKGAKVLFATHYFELTGLENKLPGIKNYNVEVKEWQDEVIFMHKIVPGSADRSYGIHVAQLAGIPYPVIERAKKILHNLENNAAPENQDIKKDKSQLDFFVSDKYKIPSSGASPYSNFLLELSRLDINSITPIEALVFLKNLKEKFKKEENK
jgi:DNA mismatch repair protein MutS